MWDTKYEYNLIVMHKNISIQWINHHSMN